MVPARFMCARRRALASAARTMQVATNEVARGVRMRSVWQIDARKLTSGHVEHSTRVHFMRIGRVYKGLAARTCMGQTFER